MGGAHLEEWVWDLVLPRADKTLIIEMDRREPQRRRAHLGAGAAQAGSWLCQWTSHCQPLRTSCLLSAAGASVSHRLVTGSALILWRGSVSQGRAQESNPSGTPEESAAILKFDYLQ